MQAYARMELNWLKLNGFEFDYAKRDDLNHLENKLSLENISSEYCYDSTFSKWKILSAVYIRF